MKVLVSLTVPCLGSLSTSLLMLELHQPCFGYVILRYPAFSQLETSIPQLLIKWLRMQILDQYEESRAAREKEGAAAYGSLPKSVILVGHSMGGFVARAALIHPRLRKAAVETVLTLSTPHQ